MCHGYKSRWMRRWEEERHGEEPITYVSDPEEREPVEPLPEEPPGDPDREKVLVAD